MAKPGRPSSKASGFPLAPSGVLGVVWDWGAKRDEQWAFKRMMVLACEQETWGTTWMSAGLPFRHIPEL